MIREVAEKLASGRLPKGADRSPSHLSLNNHTHEAVGDVPQFQQGFQRGCEAAGQSVSPTCSEAERVGVSR